MIKLSNRAQNLKASPVSSLATREAQLVAQGHDVISLAVGEPDWPTFKSAASAGIEAIKDGKTKYTAMSGLSELKSIIAEKVKSEVGHNYAAKQVIIGPGAKFIVFNILQMLCSPGDEVIVGAPYWMSYPMMIQLTDGIPCIIACEESDKFKITPAKLEAAINSKTRALMFCSPCNPTGLIYSKEELSALAEVLRKHPDVVIISDDLYNRLVFNGKATAPHILDVAPDLYDRTVIVNGGSKAYSMTGWRIGWAVGPENLITAMSDYQSQATSAPSTIAQHAAIAAIKYGDDEIVGVLETLIKRRDIGVEELNKIELFKVSPPEGAFYFWVDIRKCFGRSFNGVLIENSRDFCRVLLENYYVVTVPGSECGMDGFMRLSFASSEESIRKAIQRMNELVSNLN